jgi:hypothetical protein
MTVRKIIELVDFIKSTIGSEEYSSLLQDQIVTIQSNNSNLVLLKEITDKAILDYEKLIEKEIPELLDRVLVETIRPFTKDVFYQQLIDLKDANYPDAASQYNTLNTILTQLQARVNQNITELDKLKATVEPFLTKDFSQLQKGDNAIFAIIFNNENSFNNLKTLSFELKNWDRGLFIYQQVISDETPKPFEIVEVDQGSIEVVLNLIFEVGEKLLDLFKTGLEVYAAYLAYKTVVHDSLVKSYKGNTQLIKLEEEREKLLLENVRIAVKDELKRQAKKAKKHESLEKKIEEVTKLVTEHIIKGNSVKLLSAPVDKKEVLEKEEEKENFYIRSKIDYKKLDETTKQLLLTDFTTLPPIDNYDKD